MNTAKQIQEGFISSFKHTIENRDNGEIDLAFSIYIDGLKKDGTISQDAYENVQCPVYIDQRTKLPVYSIDELGETYLTPAQEENEETNEDYFI